jgi:TIR domain
MISYRRSDSGPITGRICDRLRTHFGSDRVYMDVDSVPIGIDYRSHINDFMSGCDVLLAVIGPEWLGKGKIGTRRIDDPTDLVRLEVANALKRDVLVIPLLIDRTDMPGPSDLPEDLRGFTFRNALRVDGGVDFHHHVDRLCGAIEAAMRKRSSSVSRVGGETATAGPASSFLKTRPKVTRRPQKEADLESLHAYAVLKELPLDSTRIAFVRKRRTLLRLARQVRSPWAVLSGAVAAILLLGAIWLNSRQKPQPTATSPLGPTTAQQPAAPPPSAAPLPIATPAIQQNGPQVDLRLVGKWETRNDAPAGLRKVHWIQELDGRYTFSGPVKDSGVIKAADGRIEQLSITSKPPIEISSYKLNDDLLVTTGPSGAIEWHRSSSGNASRPKTSSHSATRREDTDTSITVPIGPNKKTKIRLPFRFP